MTSSDQYDLIIVVCPDERFSMATSTMACNNFSSPALLSTKGDTSMLTLPVAESRRRKSFHLVSYLQILSATMIWNTLQLFSGFIRHRFFDHYRMTPGFMPQLVGFPNGVMDSVADYNLESSWIWFAVPKRKHTKSRKRLKTTVHKRLPLKKNIVFDPRTGEVTLKHKLPFNWKDYLPKEE